ncbi:MAG: addiction module protein [Sulfuritalea sp.]|jgi:putative addiction module component (TIGR02574 family)|nr:addiction module protein [Sulfuritalea sp.]MDP1982269.1 addiction module protein [Sulfuritalea sp.]
MVGSDLRPRVLLVAGPNGAGKTTVTERGLAHEWFDGCEYVNPDWLSTDERIELADLLYADTAIPSAEWEAEWAAECEDRLAAFERGEIQAVDADEMHARIEKEFGLK